jgi:hypothetical protein
LRSASRASGGPGPFGLSDHETFTRLLRGAAFSEVNVSRGWSRGSNRYRTQKRRLFTLWLPSCARRVTTAPRAAADATPTPRVPRQQE